MAAPIIQKTTTNSTGMLSALPPHNSANIPLPRKSPPIVLTRDPPVDIPFPECGV